MLPTFVIGLREGLEAALIVGIVAAFLRQRGRNDLIRWVLVGIAGAISLCVAAGVALEIVSRQLPQRQQEGLETVIGVFAVAMVTYMVVWMRRHSRDLKGQLEGAARAALVQGSGWALVAMAFLAVLREGLETVVFLLAAFNEAGNGAAAGIGASLGLAVSIGLGWAIYRGGIRLNLSRFFRFTGGVLVLVAAGLVVSALHTAHEAGWLNIGQRATLDLSRFVVPGSLQSSVLTGMLGLQPRPVLIEVLGWLIYLVPMILYVTWPPGKAPSRATTSKLAITGGVVALVAVLPMLLVRPAAATEPAPARSGSLSAQLISVDGDHAVVRAVLPTGTTTAAGLSSTPSLGALSPEQDLTVTRTGAEQLGDLAVDVYTASGSSRLAGGPTALLPADLAELNGGRLPLGLGTGTGRVAGAPVPVEYVADEQRTFRVVRETGAVLDARWQQSVTVLAHSALGSTPIKVRTANSGFSAAAVSSAQRAAAAGDRTADRRYLLAVLAGLLGLLGAGSLIVGAVLASTSRPAPIPAVRKQTKVAEPLPS